jgi:hypothetical protein
MINAARRAVHVVYSREGQRNGNDATRSAGVMRQVGDRAITGTPMRARRFMGQAVGGRQHDLKRAQFFEVVALSSREHQK